MKQGTGDRGAGPPLGSWLWTGKKHSIELAANFTAEMEAAGIIRKTNSPWASRVVLVGKKDGSVRFCVDYRDIRTRSFVFRTALYRSPSNEAIDRARQELPATFRATLGGAGRGQQGSRGRAAVGHKCGTCGSALQDYVCKRTRPKS